jgi:polyisoprenoid-binding protein YceI
VFKRERYGNVQNNPLTEAKSGGLSTSSRAPVQLVSSPSPARYLIDAGISRFTLRAFATGMLSALGHSPTISISDFEGEIRMAAESFDGASLRLKIKADSLAVQDQISDKDRREMESQMKEPILATSRFPEIVYECTSVSGSYSADAQSSVVLNGSLSLRGVTRRLSINARLITMGTLLRASGDFSINQSDYEIPPVSAVGGTLRIKDELKFTFDIAARKQS